MVTAGNIDWNIKITARVAAIMDDVARFADDFEVEKGKVLHRQMRLTLERVQKWTPPYADRRGSNTLAARRTGEAAIQRDVSQRAYMSLAGLYRRMRFGEGKEQIADAIWKAAKEGDIAEVERLLRDSGSSLAGVRVTRWDGGAEHERVRSSRTGRVPPRKPQVVALDQRAMERHITEVQGGVGTTKDGWNPGIHASGGKRGAAWIARHGGRRGKFAKYGTEDLRLVATNFANGIGSLEGRIIADSLSAQQRAFRQEWAGALKNADRRSRLLKSIG